ncbi:MAG: hypothetical protein Q9170_006996, partial [Blastenia crenularia]
MAHRPGRTMNPPPRPDPNTRRASARIAAMQARAGNNTDNDDLSSSSDLDRLRPRSEIEPSDFGPQAAVEPRAPTTAFSVAVKRAIERDGSDCWHCGSLDKLEHIHLLGQTKHGIMARLQSQGLTNIQYLHQKENGMYLCNRCHSALDEVEDPGWVFIPTNLAFFLDAENADYSRRLATFRRSSDAVFPQRIPPNPDRYIQQCGGLYDSFMLRPYGSQQDAWQHRGRSVYQPNPKVWHGDPMLALFKGLGAIGKNLVILPSSLLTLGRLYDTNDQPPKPDDPTDHQPTHDDGNDDNSDVDRGGGGLLAASLNPNHTVSSPRGGPGRGRARGRGRGRGRGTGTGTGRGQTNVSVPLEVRGQRRKYNGRAAPSAPRYDLRVTSLRQGTHRGQRQSKGPYRRPSSRHRSKNRSHVMNDEEWEDFIHGLEESQELVARNGGKVEISRFKWGPQRSSNMQAEDFRTYIAEMKAGGYNMSWDPGDAKSVEGSNSAVKKGMKDEVQEGTKK